MGFRAFGLRSVWMSCLDNPSQDKRRRFGVCSSIKIVKREPEGIIWATQVQEPEFCTTA